MADAYVVFVTAGEPETGLWCESCLLPSRIRVPVYQVTESGSSDMGWLDTCTECEP